MAEKAGPVGLFILLFVSVFTVVCVITNNYHIPQKVK